jgi:hypothetical protein
MRFHVWILILLGTAVAMVGCEDETDPLGAGGGTTGKPCERPEDCDDDNPCTYDFCPLDKCVHDVIDGDANPEAEQVDGDCLLKGCAEGVPADLPINDPPDDPNEQDCNLQICEEGAVVAAFSQSSSFCVLDGMGASCDGAGLCSCSPSPNPDQNNLVQYWVDPVDGNDVPGQGARPGGCAFKTISYALTQFETGRIRLRDGVYSVASGETLPFVLTASQQLQCSGNQDNSDYVATLQGSGSGAVVVLSGNSNQVIGCNVDGQGTAASGVLVTGAATVSHQIRNADIFGADAGITVAASADLVNVDDCNIHNNATAGIQWLGVGQQGDMDDNAFSSNGVDITCADVSPGIDGENNGGPSCNGCENCPF